MHFDFTDVLNEWTDDSTFDRETEQCIRGMACNEYEQVCEYLHCGIILWALVIFRPHRMHGVQLRCSLTTDVAWFVCLSVGHNREPCKNI